MFKRFSILGSLVLICVIVLTAFNGAFVTPASASYIAPLHIKNPVSGVYFGQFITRCVGGQEHQWQVGIDPAHNGDIHWAGYVGTRESPPYDCGPLDPSTGTYPLIFSNMDVGKSVTLGTWVTQCRSGNPGQQYVFKVTAYGGAGWDTYAPYQYTESNPACP